MRYAVMECLDKEVGDVDLPDSIFNIAPRLDILARVVHWQLAKRRQGTHKAKERGDVAGSTRKIQRQKGTGAARHGSRRGAQFRGGGIIFGPVVRDHSYSLNKKVRKLGLKMALSDKAIHGELTIVADLKAHSVKTKDFLKNFSSIIDKNPLFIDGNDLDFNMKASVANVQDVHVLPSIGANVYDIVKSGHLVLSLDAVKFLEERLR